MKQLTPYVKPERLTERFYISDYQTTRTWVPILKKAEATEAWASLGCIISIGVLVLQYLRWGMSENRAAFDTWFAWTILVVNVVALAWNFYWTYKANCKAAEARKILDITDPYFFFHEDISRK